MSHETIVESPQKLDPPTTRARLVGLVVLVALLAIALPYLESDLVGRSIQHYVSSEDFDMVDYETLLASDTCSSNERAELTPSAECVPFDDHGGIAYSIVMISIAAVGSLLVYKKENPVGWLLILAPLADLIGANASAYATRALITEPGTLPAGHVVALVGSVMWIFLLVVLVPRFLIRIPSGHLPSAGWRWAERFTYVVAALLMTVALFHPLLASSIPNPISWPWHVDAADELFGVLINGMLASWALGALALATRVIGWARVRLKR